MAAVKKSYCIVIACEVQTRAALGEALAPAVGLDLRSSALLIGTFYEVAVATVLLVNEVAGLGREGNADGDTSRTSFNRDTAD